MSERATREILGRPAGEGPSSIAPPRALRDARADGRAITLTQHVLGVVGGAGCGFGTVIALCTRNVAGGAHLVTTTSLIRPGRAVCQTGVLEGTELLAVSTHLADVLLIAAGTVRYGARYTCCSGGVGLLVIVASRALERILSVRALLAVSNAAIVVVTA